MLNFPLAGCGGGKAAIKDVLTAFPAITGPRANQFPGVRQTLAMVNDDT